MNYAETLSDTRRKRAIVHAIGSALCGCIPEMIVDTGAVMVIYIAMMGGGGASRMLATGLAAVANVFLLLPAAYVVDRIGFKRTVALSCTSSVFAFVLMAAAPFCGFSALWLFLAALLFFGITRPFYLAAWYPLIDNFLRPVDRNRFFGRMRFMYTTLNAMLLYAIALILGQKPSILLVQTIILVAGLFNLGRAYFIYKLPVDPEIETNRIRPNQRYSLAEGLRVSLRNGPLVGFAIYFCFINIAVNAYVPLSIVYMKSAYVNASEKMIVQLTAISLFGGIAGFFLSNSIIRIIGKKLTILLIHLLNILLILLLMFADPSRSDTIYVIGATQVAAAFVAAILNVVNSSEMMALARPGNKTVAMAFTSILGNIGTAAGRMSSSLAIALSILTPAYIFNGVSMNMFQTLFGVLASFLIICLILLFQLPAFVPRREDFYMP